MVALIWFLLIGLAAGWLAGKIMKGRSMGLVNNLIVGVIGALLGGWLFGIIGLSAYGRVGSLVTAVVGAVVLLYLVGIIKRPDDGIGGIKQEMPCLNQAAFCFH
jgi:uncharacterized membrane protein YeaQ/YmgE (transglycosylase-associated protein family)